MSDNAGLSPIAAVYKSNPAGYIGPWLVGGLADFILQGALFVMTAKYYRVFPHDTLAYKALVGFVAVLNVLKTVQTFATLWWKFVLDFGDWEAATTAHWFQYTEPLTTAIVGVVVQCFFAWRVFRLLGRNWLLLGVLVTSMLVGLGGAIALTVMLTHNLTAAKQAAFNQSVIAMLVGVFACDLIITGATLIHLQTSKTGVERTNTLIEKVVFVTWLSALPPTICAIFNLGFYVGQAKENAIFMAWNFALSKLYSLSLMYVLNSRADTRLEVYGVENERLSISPGKRASSSRARQSRSNDIALQNRAVNVVAPFTQDRDPEDQKARIDDPDLSDTISVPSRLEGEEWKKSNHSAH